jgi:beta-glucanase (GH16 family)
MSPMTVITLKKFLVPIIIALSSLMMLWLPSTNSPCGPQPVFNEDFNGDSIDRSMWNVTYHTGSGELQQYVPDAFSIENGILKIHADKSGRRNLPFNSGILTTRGKFTQKYGYF